MKTLKQILQGSSAAKIPYKVMDMENLVQDSIKDIPEDDGPHTSKMQDVINFQTVANPEDSINQPSSNGNADHPMMVAPRASGKPNKTFKAIRQKKMSYGVEDLSGAVAQVAVNEEVELINELSNHVIKKFAQHHADARDAHLRKAKEHENGAEVMSFDKKASTQFKIAAARHRYQALKHDNSVKKAVKRLPRGTKITSTAAHIPIKDDAHSLAHLTY